MKSGGADRGDGVTDKCSHVELIERVAKLEAARETQDRVLQERDVRYTEQFQAGKDAVASALTAAKELTAQAFAASEKAITESKHAQEDVNAKSNEFRGQLKDQNDTMIPRPEAAAKFNAIEEKIEEDRKGLASLREAAAGYPSRNEVNTMIGAIVKEVADLRESRSEMGGRDSAKHGSQATNQWIIGVLVGAGIALAGLSIAVAQLIINLRR